VPPWIRVRNLASRVLSLNLRRLGSDWQERWGHPVYMAETFVDTSRFKGTCYRASNWTCLGHTAGRSKRGNQYLSHGTPKAYYVYPLHRRARDLLCHALPRAAQAFPQPPTLPEEQERPRGKEPGRNPQRRPTTSLAGAARLRAIQLGGLRRPDP
jgi:hypothetical protein